MIVENQSLPEICGKDVDPLLLVNGSRIAAEAIHALRAHRTGALHSRTIENSMASENRTNARRLTRIVFNSLMVCDRGPGPERSS